MTPTETHNLTLNLPLKKTPIKKSVMEALLRDSSSSDSDSDDNDGEEEKKEKEEVAAMAMEDEDELRELEKR